MNSGWFVVIGALLGFLGATIAAWFNNRGNNQRHQTQLSHDAEQRRLERERSLQRDIYLGVLEAVAKWQEYLASFADPSISQQDQRQMLQGATQQISKAYIIGSIQTLTEIDRLNVYFSENALILAEKRLEIMILAEQITSIETEIRIMHEQETQLFSIAKLTNEGTDNKITFSSFERTQSEVQRLRDSLNQMRRERDLLMISLLKEIARVGNEFAVVAVDGLISARRELGMETNENFERQLRQSTLQTAQRIYTNANKWVEKVSQKYGYGVDVNG